MPQDIRYRHEWKHVINHMDVLILRGRLRAVMRPDPHAPGGSYLVRSLYFDTPDDRVLREKIDGVNMREKFRIRYYNGDLSMIRLEKKSRRNGLGTKYSALLTKEEVLKLLAGDHDFLMQSGQPLLQEFYVKIQSQGLRPRTIVDYTREPFLFDAGGVRVTLDYDLRTGMHCEGFLRPDCVTIPAGDAPAILEVKWNEFLPSIVRDAVQLPGRRETAFSKYAQCRIYDT